MYFSIDVSPVFCVLHYCNIVDEMRPVKDDFLVFKSLKKKQKKNKKTLLDT